MLNPGVIGGIAGGGALVLLGSSWRLIAIRHRHQRLDRALRDADPATRLAALDLVGERGVSAYLGVLVERALVETDPEVEAALVEVLTRGQWEPSADPRVLQLRAWAKRAAAGAAALETRDLLPQPAVVVDPGRLAEPELGAAGDDAADSLGRSALDAASGQARAPGPPTGDALGSAQDPIEAWLVPDPWAGERVEGLSNGARTHDLEPANPIETVSVDRAEQSAIKLLREAGYAVVTSRSESAAAGIPSVGGVPEPETLHFLREMFAQRVITVTIMEEAVRRMRAENARLEEVLRRDRDRR